VQSSNNDLLSGTSPSDRFSGWSKDAKHDGEAATEPDGDDTPSSASIVGGNRYIHFLKLAV
jgi:hypothetical protein